MTDSTTASAPRLETRLLGTAGHIDHGKSALVKALTGTDPDRLPEEQRRGMTIVLGYACFDVVADETTWRFGVVDVPGHERFIRTMVSGATGIDLAMLAIAADDGWMPQTQEHLEILDLLGIEHGIIAITKADAAPPERVAALRSEIPNRLANTNLASWPIVTTSARSGTGLDLLRKSLVQAGAGVRPRRESSLFRLAIDRVFPVRGRGTVVTGSVLSGRVSAGDELDCLPGPRSCRVREVQNHGQLVDEAGGGQRAALNLTGLERETIDRGMELATPGCLAGSRYLDARLRVLPRNTRPLRSHQRLRVLIGTSECPAAVVVIGADEIPPGNDAYVQLRTDRPLVAGFAQRFIVRDDSTAVTVGGGVIIRPQARRAHPHLSETSQSFTRATNANPRIRLAETYRDLGFDSTTNMRLAGRIGVEQAEVAPLIQSLRQDATLLDLGGRVVHRDTLDAFVRRAERWLLRHHASKPLEPGVGRDRFVGWLTARSTNGLGKRLLDELTSRGLAVARGPYMAHASFRPAMSPEDDAAMSKIITEIESGGFDPPAWEKLAAVRSVSAQRARALSDIARTDPRLVSIAAGQFVAADAFDRFRDTVAKLGANGRRFKLAEVRDATGQTRRVVQPLLEHLDRIGVTKRIGDERVLS